MYRGEYQFTARMEAVASMSHAEELPTTMDGTNSEQAATNVLVGKLNQRQNGIAINAELVDTATGWQLWGEHFDLESYDLLQIHDRITRQPIATLKPQFNSDEKMRVSALKSQRRIKLLKLKTLLTKTQQRHCANTRRKLYWGNPG
jgi:hypothetical protein